MRNYREASAPGQAPALGQSPLQQQPLITGPGGQPIPAPGQSYGQGPVGRQVRPPMHNPGAMIRRTWTDPETGEEYTVDNSGRVQPRGWGQQLPSITGPGGQPISALGGQSPVRQLPSIARLGGAPSGGMVTGSTFNFDQALPGGQTSTEVYALPGGMYLPDASGLTSEDFASAFKQMNPGKSMVDAIRGLSRETGPSGAAARQILKDIGATGGTPLSDKQRQEVEEQLQGRIGSWLQRHAIDRAGGIASESSRIAKEQKKAYEEQLALEKEQREKEQEIRRNIFKEAEKLKGKPEYEGMDPEILRREAEKIVRGRMAWEEEGVPWEMDTGEAPPEIVQSWDRVPASAMTPGFEWTEDGMQYSNPDYPQQQPLQAVPIETTLGVKPVPIVTNLDDVKRLPVGQQYIFEGRLMPARGRPGPTGKGAGTTTTRTTTGGADTDDVVTRETIEDTRKETTTQRLFWIVYGKKLEMQKRDWPRIKFLLKKRKKKLRA